MTTPQNPTTFFPMPGNRQIRGDLWVTGTIYGVLKVGTYAAGSTTPSVVGNVNYMRISNAAPVTITNFLDGVEAQCLLLVFTDGNTTLTATNIKLVGNVSRTMAANDAVLLVKGPSFWHEINPLGLWGA